MEKLYVFGTGNAQAVHCYNTCFALKDEDEFLWSTPEAETESLRFWKK